MDLHVGVPINITKGKCKRHYQNAVSAYCSDNSIDTHRNALKIHQLAFMQKGGGGSVLPSARHDARAREVRPGGCTPRCT
jgi:hypothetical protein